MYGMFSDAGNAEVANLVNTAKTARLTWPETYALLNKLSDMPDRGEAMDTAVREAVYHTLKFNTPFYC